MGIVFILFLLNDAPGHSKVIKSPPTLKFDWSTWQNKSIRVLSVLRVTLRLDLGIFHVICRHQGDAINMQETLGKFGTLRMSHIETLFFFFFSFCI